MPRRAYVGAIAIKGIDGTIETIVGAVVAIAGAQRLSSFVIGITAPELDYGPESTTVRLIRHGALGLAHAPSRFIVVWLLAHGVLKLALAIELLRGKSWIFSVATAILAGFIAYMGCRLAGQWSAWLFAFALFDVVTLALVLDEWRAKTRDVRVSPIFSQSG